MEQNILNYYKNLLEMLESLGMKRESCLAITKLQESMFWLNTYFNGDINGNK